MRTICSPSVSCCQASTYGASRFANGEHFQTDLPMALNPYQVRTCVIFTSESTTIVGIRVTGRPDCRSLTIVTRHLLWQGRSYWPDRAYNRHNQCFPHPLLHSSHHPRPPNLHHRYNRTLIDCMIVDDCINCNKETNDTMWHRLFGCNSLTDCDDCRSMVQPRTLCNGCTKDAGCEGLGNQDTCIKYY